MIRIFDTGYVKLHDVMGSDLTVVNAARVSYDKKKDKTDDKDVRLIRFLAQHGHTSPFRHASLQFEVYAPLLVARQWWKYVVGSDHVMDAWNESSRRYITEECEFYVPTSDEWRSAPDNKKQGSGELLPSDVGFELMATLDRYIQEGESLYNWAMDKGACAEQARLFLPAYAMYVRWYWTASLQSVAHLINQRMKSDAQFEFQEYAKAVYQLSHEKFPISIGELINAGIYKSE